MLLTLATLMFVSPAAAAADRVVAVRTAVPAVLIVLTSWLPAWSTTMSEPAPMPLADATLIVVAPAGTGTASVVGVSVCEYSPEPTSPVSSASNRPVLIVRFGYVPFNWYQRMSPCNSAMPMVIPVSASYGEPLPQLPPLIPLIGVAVPVCAPLATLVDVGVESLWPAIRTTWPGHDWPGIVTVALSSWYGYVWLPLELQHALKWSLAVRNLPIGPMCESSVFVDSLFHQP